MRNACQESMETAWIANTLLFRHWESMKEEILLHKWYESEKVGHDIGWERAKVDWLIRVSTPRHRSTAAS